MTKTVIAGALGECVHVAGVSNFLRLAETAGWRTVFPGPAKLIEAFVARARTSVVKCQSAHSVVGNDVNK